MERAEAGAERARVARRGGRAAVDRGARAHLVTLVSNAALAAAKLAVGTAAGSPVLVADGWHSLSDVGMNAIAWGGYRFAKAPPDEDHHYGHGGYEAIAGLLVGLIVLAAGAGIVWSVAAGEPPELRSRAWGGVALGVGLAGGVAKLALALYTSRVGRGVGSPSLVAVSRDNFGDALTSTLVPVGIAGTLLGAPWLERAAAVVIGVFVAWMGLRSAKEGLDVLMDRVADRGIRERIARTARGVEGVRGVQLVRVHPLGALNRVDMEISVDGSLTVTSGHAIAHAVERAVVEAHAKVVEVQVHVNPAPSGPERRA